jgi:hypothetical protein
MTYKNEIEMEQKRITSPAKVLITMNCHPNESYAILVARKTAENLKECGHQVIEKKFPFAITNLGKVLLADHPLSLEEVFSKGDGTQEVMYKEICKIRDGWIREESPQFVYDFHTSEYRPDIDTNSCDRNEETIDQFSLWGSNDGRGLIKPRDFFILHNDDPKRTNSVEVKAVYKPYPKNIQELIERNMTPEARNYWKSMDYFGQCNSIQQTMDAGIDTNRLADSIANAIDLAIAGDKEALLEHYQIPDAWCFPKCYTIGGRMSSRD